MAADSAFNLTEGRAHLIGYLRSLAAISSKWKVIAIVAIPATIVISAVIASAGISSERRPIPVVV